MRLVLFLLFATPFWVQFLIAGGLAYLGFDARQDNLDRQAARAALIEQAPPATLPIAGFATDQPASVPVEVSVTAQIASSHLSELIRKSNGVTTSRKYLYVLVDPEAPQGVAEARGAIVIEPEQEAALIEWFAEHTVAMGADGPVVEIAGLRVSSSSASQVGDALAEQGMRKAEGFFFIEPFVSGREAALSALPAVQSQLHSYLFGAAGIMALIGLVRLRPRRRRA